jgi:hypothetical protein
MPGPIEIHFVYFQGCPIAPEAGSLEPRALATEIQNALDLG